MGVTEPLQPLPAGAEIGVDRADPDFCDPFGRERVCGDQVVEILRRPPRIVIHT